MYFTYFLMWDRLTWGKGIGRYLTDNLWVLKAKEQLHPCN
jgi:hypothetical protein